MENSSRLFALLMIGFLVSCSGQDESLPEETTVSEEKGETELIDTTTEVVEIEDVGSEELSFEERYGSGVIVFNHEDLSGLNLFPKADEGEDPFFLYPDKIIYYDYDIEGESPDMGDWEFYSFYPEYDLMHVICLKRHSSFKMNEIWYTDEKSYGIYDSIGTYYSWQEYLKEFSLSINPINEDGLYEGIIRAEPNDEADDISEQADYGVAWVPVDFNGNWVKIDVYEGPCQEGEVQKTGWIKWRDEFKLLISISYIC